MNLTSGQLVIAVAVLAIALVALIAWMIATRRRTAELRARFGHEYDTTVNASGSERRAEAELKARRERVEKFDLHPLSPTQRQRYIEDWRLVQADFVDEPPQAVQRADGLLRAVMEARGYPVSDFEQQAADLSVDHGDVVTNYRAAHDIALRHGRGEADTEDLRQAMIHYRALFDDLVNEPAPGATLEPRHAIRREDRPVRHD